MKLQIVLCISISVLLSVLGCKTSSSGQIDVDEDVSRDTKISSKDLRTMAKSMAQDILQCPQIKERIKQKKDPAVIAFAEITDETKDYDFSPMQLQTAIRGELLEHARGYVTFVESEKRDDRLKIQTGVDAKDAKESVYKVNPNLVKPEYMLTGRAYSKRTRTEDVMTQYHAYTFWLTHVETGVVVWQNEYEVKKGVDTGTLHGRE